MKRNKCFAIRYILSTFAKAANYINQVVNCHVVTDCK